MKILPILLVLTVYVVIVVGVLIVIYIFDPSGLSSPLTIISIAVGSIVTIAAILSGLQDGAQLFEGMLSSFGLGDDRKYRKKYLEYMYFRHRNFDVKGLTTQGVYTLELSRIFVELSIAPRNSQNVSNNPLAPSKNSSNHIPKHPSGCASAPTR